MIQCLADMQYGGDIEGIIETLEEFQEMLLYDQDESPENLLKRIHLMKSNKCYIEMLNRLLIKEGDAV